MSVYEAERDRIIARNKRIQEKMVNNECRIVFYLYCHIVVPVIFSLCMTRPAYNVQLGETLTTITGINKRVEHGLKRAEHGAPPRKRSSRRHAAVAAREKILTLTQTGTGTVSMICIMICITVHSLINPFSELPLHNNKGKMMVQKLQGKITLLKRMKT